MTALHFMERTYSFEESQFWHQQFSKGLPCLGSISLWTKQKLGHALSHSSWIPIHHFQERVKHAVVTCFFLVVQLHIMLFLFSCLGGRADSILPLQIQSHSCLNAAVHYALFFKNSNLLELIHLTTDNHLPLEISGRGHFFHVRHFNHCNRTCLWYLLLR